MPEKYKWRIIESATYPEHRKESQHLKENHWSIYQGESMKKFLAGSFLSLVIGGMVFVMWPVSLFVIIALCLIITLFWALNTLGIK